MSVAPCSGPIKGIACNARRLDTLMQDRKPTNRRKPLATHGLTIPLGRGLGRARCHRSGGVVRNSSENLSRSAAASSETAQYATPSSTQRYMVISVHRARYRCRIGAARRGYCRKAYEMLAVTIDQRRHREFADKGMDRQRGIFIDQRTGHDSVLPMVLITWFRPRARRDITVPIGTPVTAAISR